MTATRTGRTRVDVLVRHTEGWHRPLLLLTGVMAVAAVLTLAGVLFDDRVLTGEPVWMKSFKFAMSFGTFTLTWAWMQSLLPTGRGKRFAYGVGSFLVLVLVVEYAGVVLQAFRGVPAHFNEYSEFNIVIVSIMRGSAILIMLSSLVLAVVFFWVHIADRAAAWAIRTGALLSVAGMAFGPLMGRETEAQRAARLAGTSDGIVGGHSVGVPDGGPGLPVTGWSTVGGDLRIPHLVGIHAVQVLPLLVIVMGLLAGRYAVLRLESTRTRLVWVFAVSYAGLLVTVAWQAFRGQSLVRPDAASLAAFAAVASFALVGSAAVIGLARHRRIMES
jgi:hypothetical protein